MHLCSRCRAFLRSQAALRSRCYDGKKSLQAYGSAVAALVTTQAQARAHELLLAAGWPSQDEAQLLRWASNSTAVRPPPHATRQQYKHATALEALVRHRATPCRVTGG